MSSIRLEKLDLDYPLVNVTTRSLKNQVLNAATGGLISAAQRIPVVNALRNISLSLKEGDRLGLIGHNGAGKSTLLKVLARIYQPTRGVATIDGKVVSTLNLSLGMEPEATGEENIYIRGLLLGMTKAEVRSKLDEISEFTELGDYLRMPIRVYSSGMITRLAFATVTAMDSDILLMDEAIGTGDAAFIKKAQQRLSAFMNRTKIVVIASHNDAILRNLCPTSMLLVHGEVVAFGDTSRVQEIYAQQSVSAAT